MALYGTVMYSTSILGSWNSHWDMLRKYRIWMDMVWVLMGIVGALLRRWSWTECEEDTLRGTQMLASCHISDVTKYHFPRKVIKGHYLSTCCPNPNNRSQQKSTEINNFRLPARTFHSSPRTPLASLTIALLGCCTLPRIRSRGWSAEPWR